jgi:hypothetical protein
MVPKPDFGANAFICHGCKKVVHATSEEDVIEESMGYVEIIDMTKPRRQALGAPFDEDLSEPAAQPTEKKAECPGCNGTDVIPSITKGACLHCLGCDLEFREE